MSPPRAVPSPVNQRAALVGLVLVYAATLHWIFQNKIAPTFYYLGFRYREHHVDPAPYLLAILLAVLLAQLLPLRMRKPSDFVVWVLYVMTAAPALLLPQYTEAITQWKALELGCIITLSFAMVLLLAGRGPRDLVPRVHMPPAMVWTVIALVSFGTYAYMLLTVGLSFTFVSLGDVRDIRFAYRDQIASTGPALGYLVRLQGNVVNPILVARGVYSRRWYLIAAGLTGQLLLFSATGYKLTFLSVGAMVLLAIAFRRNLRPRGTLVLIGCILSSFLALVVDRVRDTLLYTEIFVDRLLIAPGVLAAAYVKVFDGQPKTQWSYSFLSPFTHNPYSVTPEFLVGGQFIGDPRTAANANYFADGFANLGYAGIFLEGAFLIVLLWVMNSAGRHLPLVVSALILLVPTIALANSSPFTSVLTNGFAAAAILMAMLPGRGWSRLPAKKREHAPPKRRREMSSAS